MSSYLNCAPIPSFSDPTMEEKMSNVDVSRTLWRSPDESPRSQSSEGLATFGEKKQDVEGGASSEDNEWPYSSRTSRSNSSCGSEEDELRDDDRNHLGKVTNGTREREERQLHLSWLSQSQSQSQSVEEFTDLNIEDDNYSYEPPPYVQGEFEGPEKTMEIRFSGSNNSHSEGLRSLSRAQLDKICTKARCGILSHISNNHVDAYVLSESSMFVYRDKLMMKTCGTTTLLLALTTIISYASELGMTLEWFEYSRKNLLFPDSQMAPHRSYHEEISFLSRHPALQSSFDGASDGTASVIEAGGHILGPITGDHWFVYVAERKSLSIQRDAAPGWGDCAAQQQRGLGQHGPVLNIMMFGMEQTTAKKFYQDSYSHLGLSTKELGAHMSEATGISDLCPSDHFDQHSFEPCGYSLNAISHDSYSTIHVTPEPDCSYVSFETNSCLGTGSGRHGSDANHSNIDALIRNVVNVFRPQRFVLTLWADDTEGVSTVTAGGAAASHDVNIDGDRDDDASVCYEGWSQTPTRSTRTRAGATVASIFSSIIPPRQNKDQHLQHQQQSSSMGVYFRNQASSSRLNDRTTVHMAHFSRGSAVS